MNSELFNQTKKRKTSIKSIAFDAYTEKELELIIALAKMSLSRKILIRETAHEISDLMRKKGITFKDLLVDIS